MTESGPTFELSVGHGEHVEGEQLQQGAELAQHLHAALLERLHPATPAVWLFSFVVRQRALAPFSSSFSVVERTIERKAKGKNGQVIGVVRSPDLGVEFALDVEIAGDESLVDLRKNNELIFFQKMYS